MKRILSISILLIIIGLAFVSCSKKQDPVVLSRNFDEEIWGRFDYLEADYNVVKAPMTADLVMDIMVSDVYPNVYPYNDEEAGIFLFALSIKAPDGSGRSREYKFKLKDASGNFKSEKVDGYYHFELPLLSDMSFSEIGDYHFKIENKYPKEPLYGIKSLTISCLQIKRL